MLSDITFNNGTVLVVVVTMASITSESNPSVYLLKEVIFKTIKIIMNVINAISSLFEMMFFLSTL